jgi:Zn-dependent protease
VYPGVPPAVSFDPMFLMLLPVFVFSVIVHECAHGLAALWCGDPTARDQGRITLNPLPHVHPWGSIVLPLALALAHSPVLLGWAKPVPVNPANFRDPRNGPVWVALAGPASNAVLAVCAAGLATLAPTGGYFAPLRELAIAAVVINLALGLFNLIPIPPLDGSWVLMRFLRLRHILVLHQFRWVGMLAVAALLSFPATSGMLVERPLRAAATGLLGLFGIAGAGGLL